MMQDVLDGSFLVLDDHLDVLTSNDGIQSLLCSSEGDSSGDELLQIDSSAGQQVDCSGEGRGAMSSDT